MVACVLSGGVAYGVNLRWTRGGEEVAPIEVKSDGSSGREWKQLGRRCGVVAILPKSLYLVRVMELPKVREEEVMPMLELEASAGLPPEYGEVEMSYRAVAARKEGYERYEVYIARREELAAYVAGLGRLGIWPRVVLPSAVGWEHLLRRASGVDLVVGGLVEGQVEAVSLHGDGTVNIRTIGAAGGEGGEGRYERGLVECIRGLLTSRREEMPVLRIGWIGSGCPRHLGNGRVRFGALDEVLVAKCGEGAWELPIQTVMSHMAWGLAEAGFGDWEWTSNLLPREIRHRRQRVVVRRRLKLAGLLLLLGCVMLYGAMRIMVLRYQERLKELSGKLEMIRKEGEAVGRRIEQLEAVRAARETRSDFEDILAGLYDHSPPNLTYSSVELDEMGRVRLEGQAESLATAFLLPERLGRSGRFSGVQPGDASRSRRGEGAVAEFRVECRLERKGAR